jgi:uroporphyrinogen-III synthase
MNPKKLLGLNVIVTRPLMHSQNLLSLITQNGGNAISFPTLEIYPYDLNKIPDLSAYLNDLDLAIFLSRNAVTHALRLLPKASFKVAAIGPGTAATLIENHIPVDIVPAEGFDSEHLLAMPFFKEITNKKIVIFAGQGGRAWLEQQLHLRGAQVLKIALYQRICPPVDIKTIQSLLKLSNYIIVSTSGECLTNLYKIFLEQSQTEWLYQSFLVVISKRLSKIALNLGFKKKLLIEAIDASDQAILESLIKWYSRP